MKVINLTFYSVLKEIHQMHSKTDGIPNLLKEKKKVMMEDTVHLLVACFCREVTEPVEKPPRVVEALLVRRGIFQPH